MLFWCYMTQAQLTKELRAAIKETQTALRAYENAVQELKDVLEEQAVIEKIKKSK